jgi:hypothetical protein
LIDLVTYVRKLVWYVCLFVYATVPILQTKASMGETLDTHKTPMFSSTEMAIFTVFVSKAHEALLTSLHVDNTYMYMYWKAR